MFRNMFGLNFEEDEMHEVVSKDCILQMLSVACFQRLHASDAFKGRMLSKVACFQRSHAFKGRMLIKLKTT
jgi:hypothetical protein